METQQNPNLETAITTSSNHHIVPSPSSSSQDLKRTHQQHNHAWPVSNTANENEGTFVIKSHDKESPNANIEAIKKTSPCSSSTPPPPPPPPPLEMAVEDSGRERLKRHRIEMAGRVWIPDIWGQEDLLKDWIDCSVFDSSLGNNSIMSAREALVQEGRSSLRIENRC